MKLKRPRFRAQVACALAALGSSALLAGGVLASPAVAGEDSTFTGSVAPLMNPFLRLAVALDFCRLGGEVECVFPGQPDGIDF